VRVKARGGVTSGALCRDAVIDKVESGSFYAPDRQAPGLTENPNVTVLLLEAGGTDDVPSVREAGQSLLNLGSERGLGLPSPGESPP
jgi:hypothetical protein